MNPGGRVSEWDTGMEMMQEWKFGVGHKASVCNGVWEKGIGNRPAINSAVSELQALRSDG